MKPLLYVPQFVLKDLRNFFDLFIFGVQIMEGLQTQEKWDFTTIHFRFQELNICLPSRKFPGHSLCHTVDINISRIRIVKHSQEKRLWPSLQNININKM